MLIEKKEAVNIIKKIKCYKEGKNTINYKRNYFRVNKIEKNQKRLILF